MGLFSPPFWICFSLFAIVHSKIIWHLNRFFESVLKSPLPRKNKFMQTANQPYKKCQKLMKKKVFTFLGFAFLSTTNFISPSSKHTTDIPTAVFTSFFFFSFSNPYHALCFLHTKNRLAICKNKF